MKQLSFSRVNGWGGKRRRAGRKNRSGKLSHAKRDEIDFRKPAHITLKFDGYMRTWNGLKAFRVAARAARKFGLHIIHYSIQNDHIHMIVEAASSSALACGMKSLCGRLGRFARLVDRYHLEVIKSPTQMRNALEYVLLNTAKHMKILDHLDAYSSGFAFKHWRELIGRRFSGLIREQFEHYKCELEELTQAQSWLARDGWMRSRSV